MALFWIEELSFLDVNSAAWRMKRKTNKTKPKHDKTKHKQRKFKKEGTWRPILQKILYYGIQHKRNPT